jgi:hypothetical protein
METDPHNTEYRNKFILNQRGASIDINNSTDREEVKISQYSGSNITINNLINSELATNNKQTKVLYDEFKTVGNTSSEFTGKDKVTRVGENNYEIKGNLTTEQIQPFADWKEKYRSIARTNSLFHLRRGGESFPFFQNARIFSRLKGQRAVNPDRLYNTRLASNNIFRGYLGGQIPFVSSGYNGVSQYAWVADKNATIDPYFVAPNDTQIFRAFDDSTGTGASGIRSFGARVSSSTENGRWEEEDLKKDLNKELEKIQDELTAIEQKMGDGGDEVESVKRHKIQNIGATFNNYPSVRIDPKGKSIPTEIGVAETSVFKHYEGVPHVEEVDNSSNFPCGNYSLNVGNKYNVMVGSGGVQLKTSGPLSLGGSTIKLAGTKVNVAGSSGVVISSESHIDIFSQSIQLRSPKSIYIDSGLGVSNNLIVGGGLFVEGETYLNHVTAPLEVQETMQTKVYGYIVRNAEIGFWTDPFGRRIPVFGTSTPDSVIMYNHSHHFHNLPLKLGVSNTAVRLRALRNNINKPQLRSVATKVTHERKWAVS